MMAVKLGKTRLIDNMLLAELAEYKSIARTLGNSGRINYKNEILKILQIRENSNAKDNAEIQDTSGDSDRRLR